MGFFKKLFGKKDDTDELLKMILGAAQRPTTANYQFCCATLKDVFYGADFSAEDVKSEEKIKGLIKKALSICYKTPNIHIPENYYDLPLHYLSNEDKTIQGYVLKLTDVKYECDCNYVGLIVANGEKKYFTNEYYASDKTFGFCTFLSDGGRRAYNNYPRNFEEFKQAIFQYT